MPISIVFIIRFPPPVSCCCSPLFYPFFNQFNTHIPPLNQAMSVESCKLPAVTRQREPRRLWFLCIFGLNFGIRSWMYMSRPLWNVELSKNDSQSQKLEGTKYIWPPYSTQVEATRPTVFAPMVPTIRHGTIRDALLAQLSRLNPPHGTNN